MSLNLSSIISANFNHSELSDFTCFTVMPASAIYVAFFTSNALILLPLCIVVIHLGVRRWQQQRSSALMVSPLDCIAYHTVTMELFGILGEVVCSFGIYKYNWDSVLLGWALWCFSWNGETFFNILTCLEYYLAVAHPVAYLRLKRGKGPKIRTATSCCVWLLCLGLSFLIFNPHLFLIFDVCILIPTVLMISFCSLSVLSYLIGPKPGEQGGQRDRVDPSKLRAFIAISAILAALLMRCILNLVWSVVVLKGGRSACVSMAATTWFNVPGSLVLPLLFLYRAGVLSCGANEKNKKDQIATKMSEKNVNQK